MLGERKTRGVFNEGKIQSGVRGCRNLCQHRQPQWSRLQESR